MTAQLINNKPGHALLPSSYTINDEYINALYDDLPFDRIKNKKIHGNLVKIVNNKPINLAISGSIYKLDVGTHYIPFDIAIFTTVKCDNIDCEFYEFAPSIEKMGYTKFMDILKLSTRIRRCLFNTNINLIVPSLKLNNNYIKIRHGVIDVVNLPQDKQIKEWISTAGNDYIETDDLKGTIFSYDAIKILTVMKDTKFKELCDLTVWYDEDELLEMSNKSNTIKIPITITFHKDKRDEVEKYLKTKYNIDIEDICIHTIIDNTDDGSKDKIDDAIEMVNILNEFENIGLITPYI